jgi:hypothetical protein
MRYHEALLKNAPSPANALFLKNSLRRTPVVFEAIGTSRFRVYEIRLNH